MAVRGEDRYYPWFDYLRIVLASVVMLTHDRVIHWHRAGNLAVQVFFALSGWLIGGILLQLSRRELPRFYFNRAARIWVPYYIALALLVAAALLHDVPDAKWLEFIVYKFSFVYNLFGPPQLAQHRWDMPLAGTGNHFWSVNAEEQFYLLSPLLLVLAAGFGRRVLAWVAVALAAWYFRMYASIAFGVLAAVAVKRFGAFHVGLQARVILFCLAASAAAGIASGLDYDLLAPFFAIGVVMLFAVEGPRQPIGAFLGGISYPLYLNHWIGVFVGRALLGPVGLRDSALRQLLSAVLDFMIAAGLYWWIERRVLALRGRLFSPRLGLAITLAAYAMVLAGIAYGWAMAGR